MPQLVRKFTTTFSEDDLKLLCGESVFASADRLERAGHVLDSSHKRGTWRGTVRGTWHRTDTVVLNAGAGQLMATCSCGEESLCRHTVALLLHWLRDRSQFVIEPSSGAPSWTPSRASSWASPRTGRGVVNFGESMVTELEGLLEADVLPHLREVARRRQLAIVARNKAEMVSRLAVALAEPTGIDSTLTEIRSDERLALAAVHLMGRFGAAIPESITIAYRALGGAEKYPPIDTLLDLGLLFKENRGDFKSWYRVPRAVGARLPVLTGLVDQVSDSGVARDSRWMAKDDEPQWSREQLIYVVARELGRSGIEPRLISPDDEDYDDGFGRYVPRGWQTDPNWEQRRHQPSAGRPSGRPETALVPTLDRLDPANGKQLATLIGQPAAVGVFICDLLVDLGILEVAERFLVNEERLQAFFELSPRSRLEMLTRALVAMDNGTELTLVFGEDGPLKLLRAQSYCYDYRPMFLTEALTVRRMVACVIGRLAPNAWYDFHSLVRLLALMSPNEIDRDNSMEELQYWRLVDRRRSFKTQRLQPSEEDRLLLTELAAATLSGPLSWLGLVDVALDAGEHRLTAFRVRPAAAALVEREYPEEPKQPTMGLVVNDDLTVLLPSGSSDIGALSFLDRAGDLVEASEKGILFQLSARRAQLLFDSGVSGPDLIRILKERSGVPLSEATVATLERWWAGYGTVRLYDDLTLLDLGDDFALTELLATTSLPSFLIHTFSPRLVAVESRFIEDFIVELAKQGHAPRVLEGC